MLARLRPLSSIKSFHMGWLVFLISQPSGNFTFHCRSSYSFTTTIPIFSYCSFVYVILFCFMISRFSSYDMESVIPCNFIWFGIVPSFSCFGSLCTLLMIFYSFLGEHYDKITAYLSYYNRYAVYFIT